MLTTPTFKTSIRPIFIIGAPRSATSVTNWVVGQLPNVQPMPETSWIATLAGGAYQSFTFGSSRGRFSHLSNVAYDLSVFMRRIGEAVDAITMDCFRERCARLYERSQTAVVDDPTPYQIRRSPSDPKQRWIDGTPFNSYFVWALVLMFPEAVFIHNLRKPTDVATSLEGFDKFGLHSVELRTGLEIWGAHTEHARLAERALGRNKVFRLHFERLSEDPEGLLHELCAFLGEPFDPNCMLPLARRINSSDVDHKREGNLERLRALPEMQTCEALYETLRSSPPSDETDIEAMDTLRESFLRYCQQHPLL